MEHAGERNKVLKNRKLCLKVCGALSKSWFFLHDPSLPQAGAKTNPCLSQTLHCSSSSFAYYSLIFIFTHTFHLFILLYLRQEMGWENISFDSCCFSLNLSTYFFPPPRPKPVPCFSQGTSKICCLHHSRAAPHGDFTLSCFSPHGFCFPWNHKFRVS